MPQTLNAVRRPGFSVWLQTTRDNISKSHIAMATKQSLTGLEIVTFIGCNIIGFYGSLVPLLRVRLLCLLWDPGKSHLNILTLHFSKPISCLVSASSRHESITTGLREKTCWRTCNDGVTSLEISCWCHQKNLIHLYSEEHSILTAAIEKTDEVVF